MERKNDHPGVYIPPPLFFIGTFLLSNVLQRRFPLYREFFFSSTSKVIGVAVFVTSFAFSLPSLLQFFRSKNSIVTIKPANTLQTNGLYSISRNPMYVSLLLAYIGASFMGGNLYNFILLPLLIVVMQAYVIKREENYLIRRFGQEYAEYKTKVRRWI